MTRCIQCTRCVRFADEIAGTPVLGYLNRSENAEIGTFVEQAVNTELSGNLIDVCPVGALTSKPYAFKARPWELKKTETIDVHDALGANIRVDARGREVMRILPRLHEDVNEEWIDDKTRFAHDGLTVRRLDRPWVRENGKLREATWEEAFVAVAARFNAAPGRKVGALAGDLVDVESVVALKDLLSGKGSQNVECRIDGARFDASARAGYIFNSGLAAIDEADLVLLVGTNPRTDAALLNARIRKNWLARGIKVGVVGPKDIDLTYPVTHVGTTVQDIESLAGGAGDFAAALKAAQKPAMIVGMGAFRREDGEDVQGALRAAAE
jgi:NADH-quinone oxidoreductase subunit G